MKEEIENIDGEKPKKKSTKKSKKYNGPEYQNGITIGKKTYRPAEVPADQIASFIEENPIMSKYFK